MSNPFAALASDQSSVQNESDESSDCGSFTFSNAGNGYRYGRLSGEGEIAAREEAVLRSRKEAEEARAAQREFARGHCVVMVSSLLLYGVHV
jgi:hypothetical protein